MAQIQEAIELPNISFPNPSLATFHSADIEEVTAANSVHQVDDVSDEAPLNAPSLPPADTGLQAWLFLLAAFVLEMLVWGFAFTFGIFQSYYAEHDLFKNDAAALATVGTAQSGIMYIGMLPMFYSLLKFPSFGAWALPVGLAIMW
jgi:hypothetical protein